MLAYVCLHRWQRVAHWAIVPDSLPRRACAQPRALRSHTHSQLANIIACMSAVALATFAGVALNHGNEYDSYHLLFNACKTRPTLQNNTFATSAKRARAQQSQHDKLEQAEANQGAREGKGKGNLGQAGASYGKLEKIGAGRLSWGQAWASRESWGKGN